MAFPPREPTAPERTGGRFVYRKRRRLRASPVGRLPGGQFSRRGSAGDTPFKKASGFASRELPAVSVASIELLIGGGLTGIVQRDAMIDALLPWALLLPVQGLECGWGAEWGAMIGGRKRGADKDDGVVASRGIIGTSGAEQLVIICPASQDVGA